MAVKDWLTGMLRPDGYLKTESGKILLTTLPKGASQPPEAATLPVAEEDLSKTALVRGYLVGNVLYSAQAVETLPRLTGALIQKLAEKGIVSLTEIQERLSELENEQEAAPPKKLCALVIGHKKSSPGAVNERAGISEFDFNEDLAIRIEKKIQWGGWGTGLTNWTYYIIWMQMSYCKEVRHATTSQTGCPPASPELATRLPCIK
jgi:hypothetical protein